MAEEKKKPAPFGGRKKTEMSEAEYEDTLAGDAAKGGTTADRELMKLPPKSEPAPREESLAEKAARARKKKPSYGSSQNASEGAKALGRK